MGWFEEQIKQRKESDSRLFHETFASIAASVTGDGLYARELEFETQAANAIEEVLRWFHITPREVPPAISSFNDRIEFLCRPNGLMRRTVDLPPGWWKDAIGPMIGFLEEDNVPVALLPRTISGYTYHDPRSGKTVILKPDNERQLKRDAICFYRPFPLRSMKVTDLLKYIWSITDYSDLFYYIILMAVGTWLGMLSTRAGYLLMGKVLSSGNYQVLIGIASFIIGLSVCQTITSAITTIASSRIDTRRMIMVKAAAMMRMLSLPPSFFKKYSSGELTTRMNYLIQLVSTIYQTLFGASLTSVFSLVYITQIFRYAPSLVVPSLLIIVVNIAFYLLTSFMQIQISRRQMKLSVKESGLTYAIISGMQKIRLSGSEKRIFARWGKLYAKRLEASYNPPFLLKTNATISTAIGLFGTLLIYSAAIAAGINYQEYYAFSNAYGMVYSALLGLTSIATQIAGIRPIMEMVEPLLKETPEVGEGKEFLTALSGSIEVSNVSFRYEPEMPDVLCNLSFRILPGQYIAIVGKSGCGKSTLVRLLLGFETPQKGAIYYDGRDIQTVDMKSLRQKIGTVTQNGKLFSGSIYENIVISAPWLTINDAWEAAEVAGFAEDIRRMPMGMHTMVTEGSGGFSGGQKQRIMIARAIAPKPKILIFDEATSALDNLTQKKVSDALDNLNCTRIVIAHRLSTIQHCDRIICLDGGRIIEDGTYEELMKLNGFFADLVSRQVVDETQDTV